MKMWREVGKKNCQRNSNNFSCYVDERGVDEFVYFHFLRFSNGTRNSNESTVRRKKIYATFFSLSLTVRLETRLPLVGISNFIEFKSSWVRDHPSCVSKGSRIIKFVVDDLGVLLSCNKSAWLTADSCCVCLSSSSTRLSRRGPKKKTSSDSIATCCEARCENWKKIRFHLSRVLKLEDCRWHQLVKSLKQLA